MPPTPSANTLFVGLRDGDDHAIGSYAINPATGVLTPIGEVAVTAMPCYLSTDPHGSLPVGGLLRRRHGHGPRHRQRRRFAGPAVDTYETERFAHYIATDPSNRYAFVPHVESANSIYQFLFDADTGKLTSNPVAPILACGPGEGPRHLAFHPNLDVVYADNEQGSSVTVYRFDTSQGTLQAVQTVSTLPDEDFPGREANSNAQLHIHPSGKSIYASNRGHDSIAMFAIDPDTGLIRSLGQQPGEATPRPFAIEPQGKFMYGGGDGSTRLVSYRIDEIGRLEPFGAPYELGGSTCWVYPLRVD